MWFITVFEKIEPNERMWVEFGDQRTWGYYAEREKAVQALHGNWTDMWETCYDYAVIEFFEEGVCMQAEDRQFFKWDDEHKGYFEIEEPLCVKHLTNFAIG